MAITESNTPLKHVAFIMDGNRRWARSQYLSLKEGYRCGAEKLRDVVSWGVGKNIPYLSFFAFGKDNWKRSQLEVDLLWGTLTQQAKEIEKYLREHEVAFVPIGDEGHWPKEARRALLNLQEKTAHFTRAQVGLIIDYSGCWDIEQAVAQHAQAILIDPNMDQQPWQRFLKSSVFPNPEILIRTSSEKRLSNFYLYNLAYSELFFPQCYWPDFSQEEFESILVMFDQRQRRFGQ